MSGPWKVKIPEGKFMAGIHRFKTKKAAADFANHWAMANNEARPEITRDETKDSILRSLGLTKVRGAVSGRVYWE